MTPRHPDQSEAEWRDLFMWQQQKEEAPRLRCATLGVTEET